MKNYGLTILLLLVSCVNNNAKFNNNNLNISKQKEPENLKQEVSSIDTTILGSLKYVQVFLDEEHCSKDIIDKNQSEIVKKIISFGEPVIPHLIEEIKDTSTGGIRIADFYNYKVSDIAIRLIYKIDSKSFPFASIIYDEFDKERYDKQNGLFQPFYYEVFFNNSEKINYENRMRVYHIYKSILEEKNITLLNIIKNSEEDLLKRIESIQSLTLDQEKDFIGDELKKILHREETKQLKTMNWDPVAAERVIDWYILEALNKLGDDSENDKIPLLIAQAGDVLFGPDDELQNASKVLKSIGNQEIYSNIIDLAKSEDSNVLKNTMIILTSLDLPNAPTGGNTSDILPPEEIEFQFTTFKEEMELYVKESKGKIKLSDAVRDAINLSSYERGSTSFEISLITVIEQNLDLYIGFTYYIEDNRIIICTYKEAALKWQKWQKG